MRTARRSWRSWRSHRSTRRSACVGCSSRRCRPWHDRHRRACPGGPALRRQARRHGTQHGAWGRRRVSAERRAPRRDGTGGPRVIVCKFGGTSVGDAEAIARTATIIAARRDRQPIVVVSELAGATNALLAIAEQAARGQLIGALRAIEELRERHLDQAQLLLAADQAVADDICAELSAMFDELAMLA